MVYTFIFKYNFPKIDANKGSNHIHFPERISHVHKLGAPFFRLGEVVEPINNIIRYNCSTLGRKSSVVQYSNHKYHSELLFKKHASSNKDFELPYLKLKFNVKPYNDNKSHVLYTSFVFWNPLLFFVVPLLPFIVFINGIEVKNFLENDNKVINEHPMLFTYRKNILD